MPRGIPNKKKHEIKPEIAVQEAPIEAKEKAEEIKPLLVKPVAPKPKLEPLAHGQAYFESPDGTIIIGDDTKDQIWHRQGNGGRGMFINKKR